MNKKEDKNLINSHVSELSEENLMELLSEEIIQGNNDNAEIVEGMHL